MTEKQAVDAILQAWQDGWEALHPDDPEDPDYVPYTFNNETFETVATWVRVTIVPMVSNQASLGAVRRWARTGEIAVQIFARPNEGLGTIAILADDVRTVLEGQSIHTAGVDEPVCTYAGSSGSPSNDGAWQQLLVRVPYRYDHHH